MSNIDEVRLGFETAYIDGSVVSSDIYIVRSLYQITEKKERKCSHP